MKGLTPREGSIKGPKKGPKKGREMRQNIRGKKRGWQKSSLILSIFFLMAFFTPMSLASDSYLTIESVQSKLLKRELQLTINASIAMSNEQTEMLFSGIPLTFIYDFKLYDSLWGGFKKKIVEEQLKYTLYYHGLSKQFVVKDLSQNKQQSYPTLSLALGHITEIQNIKLPLPLKEENRQSREEKELLYYGNVQLWLDIEALPAPLRIPVYLSSQWYLRATPYKWSIMANHDEPRISVNETP